jgi:acetoin utilization deacetylase AcuC-like enzyme
MCEEEMPFIGSNETHISRESYEAARWAAGCGIHACRSIMAGTIDSAFCAVRPPGHHALTNRAMGFCIFNNAAIAAEYLVREYDLERIAIIDWDIHHGNGTQDYFFERNDVFYISIHQDPAVSFPGTGEPAEIGIDHGRHYTLNIALPPGSREDLYRRSFDEKIVPALEIFRPQFVIISAGFDACKEESIAFGNLPPQAFHWMTAQMVEIARNHAEGRLLSILEGGYHIPSLRRAVASHIQALLLEPVS